MAAFSNKAPMLLALIGFAAADSNAMPIDPTVKASAFKKDTHIFEDAALTTENTETVDFGLKIAEERREFDIDTCLTMGGKKLDGGKVVDANKEGGKILGNFTSPISANKAVPKDSCWMIKCL